MPKMPLRFLTDENIAKHVVKALRNERHNVKDIKEEKLFGTPDKEIIKMSIAEDRIILTHDKDFANILDFPVHSHNGVVLIRYRDLSPKNVVEKFIPLLETKLRNRLKKSLVVIKDDLIKIET